MKDSFSESINSTLKGNQFNLLVSVHMITYNHEKFIDKSIEGILIQERPFDIEIVIGEDCSSDSTRIICEKYAKKYPDLIRLLPSEMRLGMIQNGYRTFLACRGKYIAFCEGDDFWHDSGKLKKQVQFLENNLDYGMIHTNVNNYNTVDKSFEKSVCKFDPDYDDRNSYYDILTGNRQIATLSVCVRRELLFYVLKNVIDYTNNPYLLGDKMLWLEIARLTKIKYFDESMATYNILADSASNSTNPHKRLNFQKSAKEFHYHYLSKYSCPPDVALLTKQKRIMNVLNCAIMARSYDAAKTELSELKKLGLKPSWSWKDYVVYWSCHDRVTNYLFESARKIKCILKIILI